MSGVALLLSVGLFIWLIVLNNKVLDIEYEVHKLKKGSKQQEPESKTQVAETQPEQQPAEAYSEPVEEKTPTNFANLFLENISNKIGAIALLVGLGIFIKIIAPFLVFTPLTKVLLATAFSAITLFIGLKLNKEEKFKIYSEVVIGVGLSALFITLYCATSLLNLINLPVATILAILLTMGGFYLADKLKTTSAIWIILITAFLNPLFINKHITSEFLCVYLILLNIMTSAFVARNPDKSYINIVTIAVSTILAVSVKNIGMDINVITKTFFGSLAIFYAVLAYTYKTKAPERFQQALYAALSTVLVFSFFDTTSVTRIVLLAFEALVISYFAQKYDYLKVWILTFYGIASACVLFNDADYQIKAIGYPATIVPVLLTTLLIKDDTKNKEICQYLALALGFFFVHETAVFLKGIMSNDYVISCFWLLYSCFVTVFGIFKNINVLKYSGVALFILTTLRILFIDMSELSSIYRTVALLTLGGVLMLVSYLYTKYKNN